MGGFKNRRVGSAFLPYVTGSQQVCFTAAGLAPAGWIVGCVLPRIWALAATEGALPLPLWHLLLDDGLLVEGTGCPAFYKICVRTSASDSCGGHHVCTTRALLVMKAQPCFAPE